MYFSAFHSYQRFCSTSGYLSGQFGSSLLLNPATWVNQYNTLQLPIQERTRSLQKKQRDILPILAKTIPIKSCRKTKEAGVPYLYENSSFQETLESSKNFGLILRKRKHFSLLLGIWIFKNMIPNRLTTLLK